MDGDTTSAYGYVKRARSPEVHSHASQDFVGLVVVCQIVTLVRLSDFLRRRMTRDAPPNLSSSQDNVR